MTPGPHPNGEGPDEAEGNGGSHDEEEKLLFDSPDEELKGWIPPEDRLWRHPSELSSGSEVAGTEVEGAASSWAGPRPLASTASGPVTETPVTPLRDKRRRPTMGAVGAVGSVAAAILLIAAILLARGQSSPTAPSTQAISVGPGTHLAIGAPVATDMGNTSRDVVLINANGSKGDPQACGVSIASGDLIVTTAEALQGATSYTVQAASGHSMKAHVVATDLGSDVALLRVQGSVPVAHFVDDADIAPGQEAAIVGMWNNASPTGANHGVIAKWSAAIVNNVAAPATLGDARGIDSIQATPTTRFSPPFGSVLVDSEGAVLGLSPGPSGASTQETFIPAQLVADVAQALTNDHRLHHGWLGIVGRSATSSPATEGSGVIVVRTLANGPAHGVLQAGDIIKELNGEPVRSMVELQARLYPLVPNGSVELAILRDGTLKHVSVVLGSSP